MNHTANPTADFIGELQWKGHYWGPNGAIALGKKMFGKDIYSSDKNKKIRSIMALASLYYSAATSAGARFKLVPAYAKPLWLMQSIISLFLAWTHIEKAGELSEIQGYNLSVSDYDIIQTVARRCAKECPSFLASISAGFEKPAWNAVEKGLRHPQCKGLIKALLLCGRVSLYINEGWHSRCYSYFDESWRIAMEIHTQTDKNTQEKRQLARVFRHLAELAQIAVESKFQWKDVERILVDAQHLVEQYKTSSDDQQLKFKASVVSQ